MRAGRYSSGMERRTQRHRYSDEEVGDIIRLASRLDPAPHRDEDLDADAVRRIAAELGIGEQAVDRALADHSSLRRRRRWGARARKLSVLTLEAHALFYAVSMSGLAAIDLAEGGGFDFVHYPLFGWGILLGWHGGVLWLIHRRSR